jgi:hypothetical protein
VTLLVFLLLLPAVVVVTGTWAWRYQLRVLSLLRGSERRLDALPTVRLADVLITDRDRVALEVEHPGVERREQFAVALDVPSVALTTLQAWHDGRAPLILIVPEGRNIIRFRCDDPPETLTLRRVA